jgi:hypothetical protein
MELKYNAFRILNSASASSILSTMNLTHNDGTVRNLCSGSNVTNIHTQEYNRIVTERYSAVHKLSAQGKDFVYSWWNTSLNNEHSAIAQAYTRAHFNDVNITHSPSSGDKSDSGGADIAFVYPVDMITNSSSSGLYYFSDSFSTVDRWCVRMAGTLSECYNSDVTAVSKVKSGRSTSLFCPVNTYGADPGQEHVAELLYQCVYSRHNASVRVYLDKTEQFGYSIPTQAIPLYDSDSIHGNSMEPLNYNPVVSGSSPNSGPIGGGTVITYTGLNLHSIRYCLFVLASGSDNRYIPGGNSKYKYAVNATAVGDNSFQCITPDVSAANSLVAHVSFSINEIAWCISMIVVRVLFNIILHPCFMGHH